MALQGYADQPCPKWDSNPQPQYMSWQWITPNSRHLKPLGHTMTKTSCNAVGVNAWNITIPHIMVMQQVAMPVL